MDLGPGRLPRHGDGRRPGAARTLSGHKEADANNRTGAGVLAGLAVPASTAAAAQTGGCSRPVCRRRPWPAPWRARGHGAHRKAALLSSPAAREHKPGRRIDRRRPARSAAWWGLSLQSTSPSFASCLRKYPAGSGFLPLQLSTTHTPASAFPTPSGVRHKRNHSPTERGGNCHRLMRNACVPPVLGRSTGSTQAPCVSDWTCTQIAAGYCIRHGQSGILGFLGLARCVACEGQPARNATIFG